MKFQSRKIRRDLCVFMYSLRELSAQLGIRHNTGIWCCFQFFIWKYSEIQRWRTSSLTTEKHAFSGACHRAKSILVWLGASRQFGRVRDSATLQETLQYNIGINSVLRPTHFHHFDSRRCHRDALWSSFATLTTGSHVRAQWNRVSNKTV